MNPVFWFLVILALVGVWFALMKSFRPLGKFFLKHVEEVKEQMSDENEKIKNEGEDCTL